MKKDLIFAPILLVVGVLLGLLKVTGMPVHSILSVVGAVILVIYTVATKKDWEMPALEIIMRALYGAALLSGIVLKIKYIVALGIIHKLFAIGFVIALIVLFIIKLIKNKKS